MKITLSQVLNGVFTAIVAYCGAELKEFTTTIQTLNTSLAVLVQKVQMHDEQIRDFEARIRSVETSSIPSRRTPSAPSSGDGG